MKIDLEYLKSAVNGVPLSAPHHPQLAGRTAYNAMVKAGEIKTSR